MSCSLLPSSAVGTGGSGGSGGSGPRQNPDDLNWNNVLIALFAIAAAIPLWQYVNRRYLLKVGAVWRGPCMKSSQIRVVAILAVEAACGSQHGGQL
jgi:hypothetical protein